MSTRIYLPDSVEGHLFLATWLSNKIPDFEPCNVQCVAVMNGQRIGCVMGYSNPHYNRVELCVASEPGVWWFTRDNCLQMLGLPFTNMQRQGVTAMVFRGNTKVRRWLQWAGFRLEGNIRKITHNGTRNMLMYGLLRSEYIDLVEKVKGPEIRQQFEQMYGS